MYMKNSTNIIRVALDNKFRQIYDGTFKIIFITSIFTFSIASLVDSF